MTSIAIYPFWYKVLQPAIEQLLSPYLLDLFFAFYEKEAKFVLHQHPVINETELEECVKRAWAKTAARKDLDPHLVDSWFDWSAIKVQLDQEYKGMCSQEQRERKRALDEQDESDRARKRSKHE